MDEPTEQELRRLYEPTELELRDDFVERYPIALRNARLSQRVNLRSGLILIFIAACLWLSASIYVEKYPIISGDVSIPGILRIFTFVCLVFAVLALGRYLYWLPRLHRIPADPADAITTPRTWDLLQSFSVSPREAFVECLWQCSPGLVGLVVFFSLLYLMIAVFTSLWPDASATVKAISIAAVYILTAIAMILTHRRTRLRHLRVMPQ